MMKIPCECHNPRWEDYKEDEIEWDSLGFPLHITEFRICMVCDEAWSTRWLIHQAEDITIITTNKGVL